MMAKNNIYFYLLLVILLTFTCCNRNDDDDEDDKDSAAQEVWEDTTYGLMWQKGYKSGLSWLGAKSYCNKLNWGGYSNWHLPSISELRTLVRGCPCLAVGSVCGVTDDCLEESCKQGCGPCSLEKGPCWPLSLGYPVGSQSSSSPPSESYLMWKLSFDLGMIYLVYKKYDGEVISDKAITRCVRVLD